MSGLYYLVVLVCLVATVVAWQMSLSGVEERAQLQFDRQADEVIRLFEEQMQRYTDVLHAGVGFVSGSEKIFPEEWVDFTEHLNLEERHPALSSLSVVYRLLPDEVASFEKAQQAIRPEFQITPPIEHDLPSRQPYYLPVTFIAPRRLEGVALGLDAARESRRREALERSMLTASPQITAPIRVSRLKVPGLLIFAPIYRSGIPESEAQRREEFVGAVIGSVYTQNLAEGILDVRSRHVALKVSDGNEVMYNEQVAELSDVDDQPLLTRSESVPFLGRVWEFEVHSTLAFRQVHQSQEPTLILFGGLIINALLFYLLFTMAQSNRRAITFGEKIADRYDRQAVALHKSNSALENLNEELRSFSYIVSHDLKTPLRGISALTEWIEEDLTEHLPGDDPELPELVRRLKLIRQQVKLSQGLITGVLEYSGLGADVEQAETVEVLELLNSIRVMLAVREDQLQLRGDFPVLETYQTQLFQVFTNLIGNGYKYHGNPEEAVVTVSVADSPLAGFYRFSVADNGPGIDPKHHQRIFEVFSTLQPKDHSVSSGVGLAIVKKLVVRQGGQVQVESEPGHGASFVFDWPSSVEQFENLDSSISSQAD